MRAGARFHSRWNNDLLIIALLQLWDIDVQRCLEASLSEGMTGLGSLLGPWQLAMVLADVSSTA